MELQDYLKNETKLYVEVNEDRMPDGTILPRSFVREDGARCEVDRILDVRPAASLKAGGAGLRYKVRIGRKEAFMFLEEDHGVERWFMERK
ncbi:MAG: hypothetical protein FWG32_08960 [Oscillospiraceae bacterium]|nr:hypothetical protein [Oscillospiraceae bacterium]